MPIQTKPEGNIDPFYLSPKRGLRPGLNGSRSGSEADSLLDLYGRPGSYGERSVAASADKDPRTSHDETYIDDDDLDHSRWIHRDKLAMIETQEMREAGIKLPLQEAKPARKSSKIRKEQPPDIPDIPTQQQDIDPMQERKKRRTRSPVRREEDAEEPLDNGFDLRTPEEIAADNYLGDSSSMYRQQDHLRKSSSRIPLPRSSPMPIPQGHIERDTPLPRKRGASSGDENGILYNKVRNRQDSVGSQVLLDDPDASHHTPTPTSRPTTGDSPSKTRIPSDKPTHTRKPSTTTPKSPDSQPKARIPSTSNSTPTPRTPSSVQRPKSRSGLDPRPQTAVNRPEGDPPWLATMYKPDPRLPPDQQILPTHAKRLQQEQYEREQQQQQQQRQTQTQKLAEQRRINGKSSPPLPREFSPLAEHTVNGLQPSSREADEKVMQERSPEWPLAVSTATAATASNQQQNPVANHPPAAPDANKNAGYSTVPRVNNRQGESPVRQAAAPSTHQRPLDPFEKERMGRRTDVEKGGKAGAEKEEGKKESGCGCCIVM